MILAIPPSTWIKGYSQEQFTSDATAAVVVTALLIPQSLAYAMLAGLPMELGLYASILPLVVYALLGSSRTLSVGPVAVLSLMTASTLGSIAEQGTADYVTGAITLALLSGAMLTTMGLLRLGFLANFLSHSVISGFISASGLLIALSQTKHILGIQAEGDNLLELLPSLVEHAPHTLPTTLALGVCALLYLLLCKLYAQKILRSLGLAPRAAAMLAKTAPIVGVLASITVVAYFSLHTVGVAVTGAIPSGLPKFNGQLPSVDLVKALLGPALLMSIIGYVETISVGKTLANKRGEKVDPNQELISLGGANLASAASGGFAVTGGFSRTIVNFEAGAVTQASGIMAAAGIALAAKFLTPLLYYLPKAMLAATIIVAVFSLLDVKILRSTWRFDKRDFWAVFTTIILTLTMGVETGVAAGIGLSLLLFLYRSSTPHIAEVGLIEGTEHFRNIQRYHTKQLPNVLTIRVDESLFFANASQLENTIHNKVYNNDAIAHVILMGSAINDIDFSALEMLEQLNHSLLDQGIMLHLSEIKGPVMDKLKKTGFLEHLSGSTFVTQYEAFTTLENTNSNHHHKDGTHHHV